MKQEKTVAQHFLLSKEARSFSLVKIAQLTEKQAENFFRKISSSI